MLKKIIKGTTPTRKARLVTPASSGTMSPKKKCLLPPTPTIQKKPTASRIPILKKEMSVGKGKGKSGLGQAMKISAANCVYNPYKPYGSTNHCEHFAKMTWDLYSSPTNGTIFRSCTSQTVFYDLSNCTNNKLVILTVSESGVLSVRFEVGVSFLLAPARAANFL